MIVCKIFTIKIFVGRRVSVSIFQKLINTFIVAPQRRYKAQRKYAQILYHKLYLRFGQLRLSVTLLTIRYNVRCSRSNLKIYATARALAAI